MPGVRHADQGGGVPVQDSGPATLVLHTTESSGPASYSGTHPHFEVFDTGSADLLDGTIQFIALDRTAKALYNGPGGTETNRRRGRIFQIEIVWRAGRAPEMSDGLLRRVAAVIRFLRAEYPALRLEAPPVGFHGAEFGTIAVDDSPLRFSFADWEDFGGICGHQHVPENDHWDPGKINFARLVELVLDGAPPATKKERNMFDTTLILPGQSVTVSFPVAGHGAVRYVGLRLQASDNCPVRYSLMGDVNKDGRGEWAAPDVDVVVPSGSEFSIDGLPAGTRAVQVHNRSKATIVTALVEVVYN